MITIYKPEVISEDNKSRLQTTINIDGEEKLIWFEVDEKYREYLCYERVDAFVIAILNYAMREGHDITCLAPMGEELHYQITTYLIDSVFKGSKRLYKTNIIADIDCSTLPNAGAVGTGISAGVDSFHSIAEHTDSIYKNHNITHLAFNNVGSHGEGERAKRLYKGRVAAARKFSKEYEFELIESNSNLYDQISQNHFLTHTYTSIFAVYCLQKLYSMYLYSSSVTFNEFSLKDNEVHGTGRYELLLLYMLSIRNLRLHSEGATLSRLEKTEAITKYEPSYKYLNVCTQTIENCGKCEKCTRTLLSLDALDSLDKYHQVFDVNYYNNNKQKYLTTLYSENLKKNTTYTELYPYFKNQIKVSTKIKGTLKPIKGIVISKMPDGMKLVLKRILRRGK